MRSLIEWLNQPWDGMIPFEDVVPQLPDPPTRMQVYAAMISIGGKPGSGSGYGIISSGGLYGRSGMHQQEAFAYWEFSAFVNGWLKGTEDVESGQLVRLLKKEWDRVKALEGPDSGVMPLHEAGDRPSSDR